MYKLKAGDVILYDDTQYIMAESDTRHQYVEYIKERYGSKFKLLEFKKREYKIGMVIEVEKDLFMEVINYDEVKSIESCDYCGARGFCLRFISNKGRCTSTARRIINVSWEDMDV